MKIFKYTLNMTDVQVIEMPKKAMILSCQEQQIGVLTIWAIVNPDAENEKITFEIIGTGNEVSVQPREYLATVISGPCVWHVFKINNPAITG